VPMRSAGEGGSGIGPRSGCTGGEARGTASPQQMLLRKGRGVREGLEAGDVGGPPTTSSLQGPWGRGPAIGCWSGLTPRVAVAPTRAAGSVAPRGTTGEGAAPREAPADGRAAAPACRAKTARAPGPAARLAAAPEGRAATALTP
jgi:hypothetical protein